MGSERLPDDNRLYIEAAIAQAACLDGVPANTPLLPVRRIGIVGAGTMGCGIAMSFANAGLPVKVVESQPAALGKGLTSIRESYERNGQRGTVPQGAIEHRVSLIQGALDLSVLADCDLIIEAVYEDLELKKSVFRQLDSIAGPGAILASNTSGLDIDELARATSRPTQVLGLHFFSPAHVMKLLEVVRGAETSAAVMATVMRLATQIGKIAVAVGVCPGFVGNRMLYPRQLQAFALLSQGALPWEIDRVIKAFGFKMGPFEMADLAGLDIGWKKGATTGDPLRNALCELGRKGQKSGAGYYDYPEARTGVPSPTVEDLIRKNFPVERAVAPPSDREILESCLFPLVNEGFKILAEGKAQRASDIDVIWLFGFGWPEQTGGPMRWAQTIGLDRIAAKASELSVTSPWYAPSPLLRELVSNGQSVPGLSIAELQKQG